MDTVTRSQIKFLLAIGIAAGILVVGGGALYLLFIVKSVHTDSAKIPSMAVDAASEPYTAAIEKARGRVRGLLVDDQLPGFSMAVAVDGRLVWAEAFGYTDVASRKPLTPATRFHLGSVSKTLTAVGVALLHDRGRIDLDAPVQKYVPSYPQKAWTITPRQLLGDVAGVHRIRGDNNDQPPFGHCTNLEDALKTFSAEPLLFEPRTSYRFASNGWVLLSAVITGAASEPFSTFMSRDVFAPLGMMRTILEGTDANPDLISAFEPAEILLQNLGMKPETESAADYSCFFGAGAFLSTPSDLVRLGSAMLKPGLLRKETIAVFQEPLRLKSGESTGFALGWKVETLEVDGAPVRALRHRATPFGSAVSFTMIPERKLVFAAASNGSDLRRIDPFTLQVGEAFASK